MTSQVSVHLSEEQLDDISIGMGSRESQAHLKACEQCRSKLQQFRSDVKLFNEASIAWTEATAPGRIAKPKRKSFRLPTPILALCATAMLLVTIGLPRLINVHPSPRIIPSVSDNHDSADQIAQDNQLMKDVEGAINPDEASVVEQYNLMESPKSRLKAQPKRGLE